jgi:hypothetical protein
MFMSHYQNARLGHNIKIANRCFENVAQFKYLRIIVTNPDYFCEEIRSRLNLGKG